MISEIIIWKKVKCCSYRVLSTVHFPNFIIYNEFFQTIIPLQIFVMNQIKYYSLSIITLTGIRSQGICLIGKQKSLTWQKKIKDTKYPPSLKTITTLTRAITLCPALWQCRRAIITRRLPTWRESAVGSKPLYTVWGLLVSSSINLLTLKMEIIQCIREKNNEIDISIKQSIQYR